MADVALIAIDWGTSSFRAWQVSSDGEVVAEIVSPSGIMAVQDKAFDAAFETLVGDWLDEIPGVPEIASGMITGRTGWVETPYLSLPTDVGALARAGASYHGQRPCQSLRDRDCGQFSRRTAHVMRGEETEIVGHLATTDGAEALIILLGTHSKWVHARGEEFASFGMRARRPVLLTVVQLAVSGVLCIGLGAAFHGLPAPPALAAALPEILFIELVSKGLAYVLVAIAQQQLSATCVAILVSAEAVFGAVIAAFILGAALGLTRGIGSLCIILGVVIAARIPAQLPERRLSVQTLQPQ